MVIVIHRQIQKIRPGKWDALDEIDKKYDEIEKRLKFPTETKRRLRAMVGTHNTDTLIVEYTWPSMAKMEKILTTALLDPEYQKLGEKLESILESSQWELYIPWPLAPP